MVLELSFGEEEAQEAGLLGGKVVKVQRRLAGAMSAGVREDVAVETVAKVEGDDASTAKVQKARLVQFEGVDVGDSVLALPSPQAEQS